MENGTMDRRVARTRDTLQRALLSLIRDKSYEAITIQDICDAANVGRSTFYAHYTSKDALKRSGLEHLRRRLAQHQRAALAASGDLGNRRLSFSLPLFEHARDHLDLYRALAGGHGSAVALEAIRQILSDLVRDELAAVATNNSLDSVPSEVAVTYLVGAYMAVLTWWLDRGAKMPPEKIDAIFRRLAVNGIMPS
jgi:AcrR family transcriptional regulator